MFFGKKDIFAVQITNNIYAELAQNVMTTATTGPIRATTVASATYVYIKTNGAITKLNQKPQSHRKTLPKLSSKN